MSGGVPGRSTRSTPDLSLSGKYDPSTPPDPRIFLYTELGLPLAIFSSDRRANAAVFKRLDDALYREDGRKTAANARNRLIMELAVALPEVAATFDKTTHEAQLLLDAYQIRAVRTYGQDDLVLLDRRSLRARNLDPIAGEGRIAFYHPRDIAALALALEESKPPLWPKAFQRKTKLDDLLLGVFRGHVRWRSGRVLDRLVKEAHCITILAQFLEPAVEPNGSASVVESIIREKGIPHASVKGRLGELAGVFPDFDFRFFTVDRVWNELRAGFHSAVVSANAGASNSTVSLSFISSAGVRVFDQHVSLSNPPVSWLLYRASMLNRQRLPESDHNRMIAEALVDNRYALTYLDLCAVNFRPTGLPLAYEV